MPSTDGKKKKSCMDQMRVKIKILIGFYQIVSQLAAVYSISYYPPEYERIISWFRIFNLHLFEWLPALQPACLGLPTLLSQLLFAILAPMAVVVAAAACPAATSPSAHATLAPRPMLEPRAAPAAPSPIAAHTPASLPTSPLPGAPSPGAPTAPGML